MLRENGKLAQRPRDGDGLAPLPVQGEGFLEGFLRLLQAVLLLRGLRPALEHAGPRGMARGGELESLGQTRLCAFDVEGKRPLGCEREIASRFLLQIFDVRRWPDETDEIERLQVVVREDIGDVLHPLTGLVLEPGRRGSVAGSPRARGICE